MTQVANGANFLVGRGELYIDRWLSGARQGYRFLGNCETIELTTNDQLKQKFSSVEATAPLAAQIVTQRVPELAIVVDEYTIPNLALALMGLDTTYSQTTGAVTADPLTTSVVKGNIYKTANRRISAVVVKQGVTTLVLGTDYTILDAETGLIQILATSSTVTAGSTITADYTKGTITNENKILAATSTIIDCSLLYMSNNASGPKVELEIWHACINPDGPLGLITQDFGSFKLKGSVFTDTVNHPTEPYYRLIQKP